MRLSLRYGFGTKEKINLLFKFMCQHLEKNGYIFGFINSKKEIIKLLIEKDCIEKGDETWCPIIEDGECQNIIKITRKDESKEEQYMICEELIKDFRDRISLNKFKEQKSEIDFSGEYIIVCQK